MQSHELSEELNIIGTIIILEMMITISNFIKYSLCARRWFKTTLTKKTPSNYIELAKYRN